MQQQRVPPVQMHEVQPGRLGGQEKGELVRVCVMNETQYRTMRDTHYITLH